MKKKITLFLFLLLVIGSLVVFFLVKNKTIHTEEKSLAKVSYLCDKQKTITAEYFEGARIPSKPGEPPVPTGRVQLLFPGGKTITLPQTLSADGTRYGNSDESLVFWGKGNGALVLENGKMNSYLGCVEVYQEKTIPPLSLVYREKEGAFTLRYQDGMTVDEHYQYQPEPTLTLPGVKFTIPESARKGTNLSGDSYLSIERIPAVENCDAKLFFPRDVPVSSALVGDYSVATTSDAGAGNRYEETVYATPGFGTCVGVRYFIHYSAIENYPEGVVTVFDKTALLQTFDEMRKTLILNP